MLQSKSGQITGSIYFAFDNTHFPEHEWNDFVVIVLTWWWEAVSSLEQGSEIENLRFMDGPYCCRAFKRSNGEYYLVFVDDGHKNTMVAHTTTRIDELKNELRQATGCILEFLNMKGWSNSDVKALQSAYEQG